MWGTVGRVGLRAKGSCGVFLAMENWKTEGGTLSAACHTRPLGAIA